MKYFLMEDNDQFILYTWYHGLSWQGDARSQDLVRHGIDLIILENSATERL